MSESQKAFEAKFPAMIFDMYTPTMYKDTFTETCFCIWQAAEAYGRKQALEEAIALFNQPHVEHFGSSVVEMLEELIK